MSGGYIWQQIQHDLAMVGVEFNLIIILLKVNILHSGINFCFSVLAHGLILDRV